MNKKMVFVFCGAMCCLSNEAIAQVQFIPNTISSTTQSTEGLHICDVDGDGDNDILGAAAENDHDVIWWRSDGGNPIQWTKIIIDDSFLGAGSIYAADLNNDSFLDVIVGAKLGNQVAWYENSGGTQVTWTKHVIQSGYVFPHEVFAFDVDRDGKMDVLAASSSLNEISWWKNGGGNPITWIRHVIASNYSQAKSVHVGDFNNDGYPDVVAAGLDNNRISWWENNGATPIIWTEHAVTSIFSGAHHVQAVDLNRDGRVDILGAGYYAHEIAWWKNEGGNPIAWTKQTIASNFMSVCVAMAVDLDSDGNLDVAGTSQGGNEVAWWHNDGGNPIVWTKFIVDGNFNRVWPLSAGDLDGDGDNDIVAASGYMGNNEVKWYRNTLYTGTSDVIAYCLQNAYASPQHQVYTTSVNGTGNARLILGISDLNHFNYSPDGRYLATTGYIGGVNGTWSIFIYTISTATLQRVTTTANVWDGDPAYSPDGLLVTFTRTYPLQGRNEIWVLNSDGSNLHYFGLQGFQPKFSPDGAKLAYASDVSGGWEIYTCNVSGTGIRRLTNNIADDFAPGWSPDGSKIVFHSYRDGNAEIYVMDTLGAQSQRLTINPAYDAQAKWSPDGTRIAFHSDRLGAEKHQIFVMDSNGSNVRQLTDAIYPAGAINPTWKPRTVTSIEEEGREQIPRGFLLNQNYPNPFNPSSTIRYGLPQSSFVTLTVHNILGQQVAQLVNEQQRAGYHEVEFRGDGLASGVYFYRIQAGGFVASKKLLLLK